VRNERDLLEAIVYPSASFVRSYEPMIVATKAGEEFSGVLKKIPPTKCCSPPDQTLSNASRAATLPTCGREPFQ